MTIFNDEKVCKNCCPNCGADRYHIIWKGMKCDSPPYQIGICDECGCEFHEVYTYQITVYNKVKSK